MSPHTYHELANKKLNHSKFSKALKKGSKKAQLGYQIFLVREAAGMTQRQLAAAIGTKQANISRMENGGYNFTIEMLERIAQVLRADFKIEIFKAASRRSAMAAHWCSSSF